MPIIFPPVDSASEEGLLAIGGDLNPESLLTAYSQGIFPWPISKDSPMTWFSPDPRGVLYIDNFHQSKSFVKFLKKSTFEVLVNQNFEEVITACASTIRPHEVGTWIDERIIKGYCELFKSGHAYSIGIYDQSELVGGIYGVIIGHFVSGESMFHTKSNASKMAISALISVLKKNGIPFLDTQMVTPIIENLGGCNISRDHYISELQSLIKFQITRDQVFTETQIDLNQLYL